MTREFAWSLDPGPPQPLDLSHGFAFVCPGCGADADTEESSFLVACVASVPHSEFMVLELHCETCGLVSDLCAWPLLRNLVSKGDAPTGEDVTSETPGTSALLDRYSRLVEESRREWEALYARECYREPGLHSIDLTTDHVVPTTRRLTAIAARVLAAARGCRKAVAAHPGLDPTGLLKVGSFRCTLSLDETPGALHPYALHLSVSGISRLGTLSPLEQGFLISLFYTEEERSLLWTKEGETFRPVTHFFVSCPSWDDVGIC